jgi:hypothetical protein
VNCGPPLRATNRWPSISNVTVIVGPSGPIRAMSTTRAFLKMET